MSLTVQQFFTSDINGVTVNDIKNKLDYKNKNTYEDRLDVVKSALEYGDDFYQQYFDNHFDVCINNNDFLLSDTNVCKSLETMATYLLMSEDVKNIEDSFVARQEQLEKRMSKENEVSADGFVNLLDDVEEEKPNTSNYKKQKVQTITSKDLNREDELGQLLRQYQDFLNRIKYKLKDDNKHLRKRPRFVYAVHSGGVRDDMIVLKDSLLGVHGYKLRHYSVESQLPNYDAFDYTNIRHLLGASLSSSEKTIKAKGLLFFTPTEDYQDDFNCILVDLQNIIDKTDLTDFEKDTLELSRLNLSRVDIAKELETYDSKIKRTMSLIAKKVSRQAYAMGYKDKGGIKDLS